MKLIEDWKSAWKFYSIWVYAFIGVLPDLFNAAVSSGLLSSDSAPEALNYIIKVVAFIGVAVRLVNQRVEQLQQTQ